MPPVNRRQTLGPVGGKAKPPENVLDPLNESLLSTTSSMVSAAASSSSGDTLNCTTDSNTHELNTSDFIQNTKMRGILANRAKELYGNNINSVWEKPFGDNLAGKNNQGGNTGDNSAAAAVGERLISDSFSSLIDGKGLEASSTLTLPDVTMNVTGVLSSIGDQQQERLATPRQSPSRELSLLNDDSTSDDTTRSLIGLDSMLANFDNDEETDGKTDDTADTTADLSKLIELMAYFEEGDANRRGGETSFVKSTASQGDLANLLEEKNQTSESTPLATSNNAAPTPPTSSTSLSEEYPLFSLSPKETETTSNNVAEGPTQTLMFGELMQGIENEVSKKSSSSLDNEEEDSSEIVNTKHSSRNKRRDTADTTDFKLIEEIVGGEEAAAGQNSSTEVDMRQLNNVPKLEKDTEQVTKIEEFRASSSSQESKDKTNNSESMRKSRGSVGTNASRNEENEKSLSSSTTTTQDNMISASKLDCSFLPLIEKNNIVRVEDESYAKLGVIGRGSSSKVYRALSRDCDVVALKKVKLDDLNKAAIDDYANEIALLKRLKGNPAIIQLYSAEVDLERKSILLVMELGEVDLNYVLRQQELLSSKQQGRAGRSSLNMNFIRLTWQQMLTAVHSIHEERIIHSDLKPAVRLCIVSLFPY